MTFWELFCAVGAGVVMLVMYTWFVIDVAATVAIKRITQEIDESMDRDLVDELDDMVRGSRDS